MSLEDIIDTSITLVRKYILHKPGAMLIYVKDISRKLLPFSFFCNITERKIADALN